MVNKYNRIILPFFYIIDLSIVIGAYFLAFYLRFSTDVRLDSNYQVLLTVVCILWIFSSLIGKSHEERHAHSLQWNYNRLWIAESIFIVGIFIYIVTTKGYFVSRQFLFIFLPLQFVLLVAIHTIRRVLVINYRRKGKNYRRIIIMGEPADIADFMEWSADNPEYGYKVEKSICYSGTNENYSRKLKTELKHQNYDELIILTGGSFGISFENQIGFIIEVAENYGLRVLIAPSYLKNYSGRMEVDSLNGRTVLGIRNEPLRYLHNRILKRSFDILFSLFIIVGFYWWLHIIFGLLIKISSKGPVLFKQKRIGVNSREFTCYKFRTMNRSQDHEESARNGYAPITGENDERITWIGKLLRKTNLDELPQFINIFFGSMSMVGPRPHMIKEDYDVRKKVSKYRIRQFVKPGLTGWAAINGYRGGTKDLELMKKRVEHDISYIENWSFLFDMKIILRTVWQMITFRIPNAY
jgi:Undecaprenyl-phosphate glucose phosphotransferase